MERSWKLEGLISQYNFFFVFYTLCSLGGSDPFWLYFTKNIAKHRKKSKNFARPANYLLKANLHWVKAKQQRIFFYELCRSSMRTLNWILYELIWKPCCFRFCFRSNINEPLSPLLNSCNFEEKIECNKELIGISLNWMKPLLVKFHWQQV